MQNSSSQKCWAILLAAGSGSRMGHAANGMAKQFINWRGYPLYWHSARALAACPLVEGIVFVFPPQECEAEEKRASQLCQLDDLGVKWNVAQGGPTRRDSARNGLLSIPLECGKILIHDAARPFLKPELVSRVCIALDCAAKCVVPCVPVTDTIKISCPDNPALIEATPQRSRLWAAQTPQGFEAQTLRMAHEWALAENIQPTDDASLFELMGIAAHICQGDPRNVKITSPEDLELLAGKNENSPRIGFGYDVHRYGAGRPLKLGGIAIPGGFEVVAHSDGDVLLHALMDAICGCAGLGDIGQLFPDSDPKLEGISSALLLDETLSLAARAGISIINADLTVVAQKPRLASWRQEIRRNVARLLALPEDRVNLKATTEEGLGFTGNLEGIKAYASVCAIKSHPELS